MRFIYLDMKRTSASPTPHATAILHTTVVLALSTLFSRTVVVFYNVYLSGKIGSVGIGLFELLMSVYAFAKTASTAGTSLAATRMSAENRGDFSHSMRRILFCCAVLGLFCAAVLGGLSDILCARVLDAPPSGAVALRLLAASLPFLSMASAYSGYFVAKEKMRLYAPVQICELLLRVFVTVFFLERYTDGSLDRAICSIALAILLSEILAWGFSALFYRHLKKKERTPAEGARPFCDFLRVFSRLSLPVGSGALFRASLNTVYNILVPKGFKRSGASAQHSLAAYGTVQGMALPILLYPSAVMSVLSLQLVPEIAALRARGNVTQIRYVTNRVLRLCLLFSILCASILYFFAEPLCDVIFHSREAARFLRALAPLVPVMYLDTVTDGILKGLDLQMKVLWIGVVDSLLSLLLIYVLLPPFAMTGYLLTIYAGECINTLLGQIELRRHVTVSLSVVRELLLPALCFCTACLLSTRYLFRHLPLTTPLVLLCTILATVCLGILLLTLLGGLKREELYWIRAVLFSKKRRDGMGFGPRNVKAESQIRTPTDQKKSVTAGNTKRSVI